ncbi:MAG: sialate O-acetylesterase [Verrucomicrobia bacterium]|nr:sialate O-acetylesterase [Verrucomicrobiota bacterium]
MNLRKLTLFSISTSLFLLCSTLVVQADVRLHALFTDHAILQQSKPIKVWGWAEPGEKVTVEFRKQKVTVKTSESGQWLATLKSEKAGGPDTLKVCGKNMITLNDVLVGEVWVASGQSNMEWPMSRSFEAPADIAASANNLVRHFNVQKLKADQPVTNVTGFWQIAGPLTTSNFSAVAYYFSRELQKALKVPVGVIHTSWGGSPAEVWMSEQVLASNPSTKRDILDAYATQKANLDKSLDAWKAAKAQAQQENKPFTRQMPRAPWKPTELYNGMLAPVMPYTIQGAIWYQGESNAGRAWEYRTLYADMIRNWRRDWKQGDFTFLGVQLAPFDHSRRRSLEEITATPTNSSWAELREAQVLSTKVLKNCGLAVITDVGDKDDIHPTKKAPVGARLALQARRIAYGENIVASGPTFKSMKVKDGKAVLSFESLGGGLEARGGELKGFALSGDDQQFVWAKAELQGDKIVVSHPQITKPAAVRFGWADFPVVNLFNKEGLPASPFRTDDFPMTTAPKK